MVCMAHRLQCITLLFPKHKFPVYTAWNSQMHLKSNVKLLSTVNKAYVYLLIVYIGNHYCYNNCVII